MKRIQRKQDGNEANDPWHNSAGMIELKINCQQPDRKNDEADAGIDQE